MSRGVTAGGYVGADLPGARGGMGTPQRTSPPRASGGLYGSQRGSHSSLSGRVPAPTHSWSGTYGSRGRGTPASVGASETASHPGVRSNPSRRVSYPPSLARSASSVADPYGPGSSGPLIGASSTSAYGASTQTPPALPSDFGAPQGKPRVEGGFIASTGDAWKSFRARVKSDVWKVAVVKATNHAITQPKEKHVQVILRGTHWGGNMADKSTPAGAVFHQLRKRLLFTDWIVVLKALIVFHRIFQDGNGAFSLFLAQYASNIFRVPEFLESKTEGMQHTPLIHSYAQYLERWCTTKRLIKWPERPLESAAQQYPQAAAPTYGGGFPGGYGTPGATQPPVPAASMPTARDGVELAHGPLRFVECDILQLLDEVPLLQDNLDMLLAVRLDYNLSNSAPARAAMRLCVRDMAVLLPVLVGAMQNLADQFYSVDIPEVLQGGFDMYRRYLDQDAALAQYYYPMCQTLGMAQQLPDVPRPSQSVLDEMYDHIERVKVGDIPRIRGDELDGGEVPGSDEQPEQKEEAEATKDEGKKEAGEGATATAPPPSLAIENAAAGAQMAATKGHEVATAPPTKVESATQTAPPPQPPPPPPSPPQQPQLPRAAAPELEHPPSTIIPASEEVKPAAGRSSSAQQEFDLLALLEGSTDSEDEEEGGGESDVATAERLAAAKAALPPGFGTDALATTHGNRPETSRPSGPAFGMPPPPFAGPGALEERSSGAPLALPPPYGAYPPALPPGPYPGAYPPAQYNPNYPPASYYPYGGPPSSYGGMHGDGGYPYMGPPPYGPPPPYGAYGAAPSMQPYRPPPQTGSGNAASRTSPAAPRKVTPADQHFFDLFEEAKPK